MKLLIKNSNKITRNYVLTIQAEETDENIVTMLAGIAYLSDNLPFDAVQVFEPQQNTNTNKLSKNKKLLDRFADYVLNGTVLTEEFVLVADADLINKNVFNTLTEYDKYYDQKRIV